MGSRDPQLRITRVMKMNEVPFIVLYSPVLSIKILPLNQSRQECFFFVCLFLFSFVCLHCDSIKPHKVPLSYSNHTLAVGCLSRLGAGGIMLTSALYQIVPLNNGLPLCQD